jgi:hypothetical protein
LEHPRPFAGKMVIKASHRLPQLLLSPPILGNDSVLYHSLFVEELAKFVVRGKRSWFPMLSEVPWNFRLLGPKHRSNFEIHNA